MAHPDSILIFAKAHVQLPMQIVFRAPMASDSFKHGGGIGGLKAADVIAALKADFAVHIPLGFDHRNTAQFRPAFIQLDPLDLIGDPQFSRFDSAMITIHTLGKSMR